MTDDSSIEARFAELVATMNALDGVTLGGGRRGFGSGTLQVDGRIVAMVSHGRLLLKLPVARVEQLLAVGAGLPFDAGKGRPLREWIALDAASGATWRDLAREAAAFVGARRLG